MAAKQATQSKTAPFKLPSDGLETLTTAFGEVAERGQALTDVTVRAWEAEIGRFFETFAAHSQTALKALGQCKSPTDVVAIEQEWVNNRVQAYFDSGARLGQVFADFVKTLEDAPKSQAKAETETKPAA